MTVPDPVAVPADPADRDPAIPLEPIDPASVVAQALALCPIIDGHNDLAWALREKAGSSVSELDWPMVEPAESAACTRYSRWLAESGAATALPPAVPVYTTSSEPIAAVPGQGSTASAVAPQYCTDFPRLRLGGVGAQFWSVWVSCSLAGPEAVQSTLEQLDLVRRLIAAYPKVTRLATTAAQVRVAWQDGLMASLIGVEGGHSIGRSLGILRLLGELGVRYLTLTHNGNTEWADAATAPAEHDGLTAEGRAVVAELNRLGIMVDLSHTAASTQRDALDCSTAPVIFSHSSSYAVNPHPRNVGDDIAAQTANQGGVIQVTFVPDFISRQLCDWQAEARQSLPEVPSLGFDWPFSPRPGETSAQTMARNAAQPKDDTFFRTLAAYEAEHPRPRVGVADVVEHLAHLREVVGIDHLGLGGDYDGTAWFPEGMEDVSGYPRLLEALAERHWSADDLSKLTGGNVLRVLQAAEDCAEH